MVDTTDNGFRAAIHALREIVLPAVDPTHPMAREQIALVIDWLEFQRARTPQLVDRQRAELTAHLDTAREIAALVPDLLATVGDGERTLADPTARYADIVAAREALEDALADAARASAVRPADERATIEAAVTRGAAPIIAMQRAWFAPYGLEADPAAIPSLDAALATALSPGTPR